MKANKRKEKDVMKLLTSNYEIEIKEDNMSEFTVILEGPNDSPYEGVSYLLIASNHQTFLFVSER
jgi:ubiquitin-protein ligase